MKKLNLITLSIFIVTLLVSCGNKSQQNSKREKEASIDLKGSWIFYEINYTHGNENIIAVDQYFLEINENDQAVLNVANQFDKYTFNCDIKKANNELQFIFESLVAGECSKTPSKGQLLFTLQNNFNYSLQLIEQKYPVFASEEKEQVIFEKDTDKDFRAFLDKFMRNIYLDKNLFTVLRDNFAEISPYIDEQIGFHRFYAPGTTMQAFSKENNYGFDIVGADFETIFELKSMNNYIVPMMYMTPCDLGYTEPYYGVYYESLDILPTPVVFDNEDFKEVPINIPYENVELKQAYALSGNKLMVLYFINTPSGWKLVGSNESICEA